MLRAQALKAARAKAKAAAKAAKAAAEAAANSGSPDVIVTNINNNNNNNDPTTCPNPEVDALTCAHQRTIAAIATLIQVNTCRKKKEYIGIVKARSVDYKPRITFQGTIKCDIYR